MVPDQRPKMKEISNGFAETKWRQREGRQGAPEQNARQ
jgi:hypothetical protein